MKSNKIILIAVILSFSLSCLYIFTNRMPEVFAFGSEIMDFLYGIALSTIAASIFYLFQVFIPEQRKRKILKDNFKLNYMLFKKDCISLFLFSLKISWDSELSKELLDLEKFKTYFKANLEEDIDKWHGVLNGLNKSLLKELLFKFEILFHEIDFFINNVSLEDGEVLDFLKRLKNEVYLLKNTKSDYIEIKILADFLWQLFAGWSPISGYRENDIFEEMLERV